MKGRILIMELMPFLNQLQRSQILTMQQVKEMTQSYIKQETLSFKDVVLDLGGLEVPEGKEESFNYVMSALEERAKEESNGRN